METLNINYSINIVLTKGTDTITLTKTELIFLVNSALHNTSFEVIPKDY